MGKHEGEKILFACAGTSDPVRGSHDGGILHIIRHYKPSVVCIFLSAEMVKLENEDHRFKYMRKFIESHWDGYHFELIEIPTEITDPSDLDQIHEDILKSLNQLKKEYPKAEILLNLSSGTPQMKMIFSMIALESRYAVRGIQVKNFEKSSGSSKRTNGDYDPELELECNEDEGSDTENRCIEPQLFYLRRKREMEHFQELLDQYNYSGCLAYKEDIPQRLRPLIEHLRYRQDLVEHKAVEMASEAGRQNTDLFKLYIENRVGDSQCRDYKEVSEFYLVLRNLQKGQQITDFVLRLNPFILRLELAYFMYLSDLKLENFSARLDKGNGRKRLVIDPEKLKKKDEKLYQRASNCFGGTISQREFSVSICLSLVKAIPEAQESVIQLFRDCNRINSELRNSAAHKLFCVTDKGVRDLIRCNCEELCSRIENAMIEIYPGCNTDLFKIYDRCNRYIKDHLI